MTDSMAGVSGVILLGGSSRRMGQDKASLALGGATLLQRTAEAMASVADELVLVRGFGQPRSPVRVECPVLEVSDPIEDAGPTVGLLAGLDAARFEIVLVAGVDLPFLQPALLRLLTARLEELRPSGMLWVVPVTGDQLQPLCSAIARDARDALRAQVEAGERALVRLEGRVPTARLLEREWREVDPEGLSFIDVDTPEEYEAALTKYEKLGSDDRPRR